MEFKYIILILLILILFLNFLQNQDTFFETTSTVRSLIDNKINSMIGDAHLRTDKHQSKLKTHGDLVKSTVKKNKLNNKTFAYSLTRDKILISLFYDPLDKFSRDFYDDTEVTDDNLEKVDSTNIISISDGTTKPWNLIKKLIKNNNLASNNNKNPYLHQKLIHLEEIPCSYKNMEPCHLKESILDSKSATHLDSPAPSDGMSSPIYSALQPPRHPNLVDKLPKIISSFYVPLDSQTSEHIIVEYDGDYTLFNDHNPINIFNIMKYMKTSFDKHLEIKDIYLGKELESQGLLKMVHHLQHKHPDKYTAITSNYDKTAIMNNFDLLNSKINILHPFYENKFIYKCKFCPQYVKSQKKI